MMNVKQRKPNSTESTGLSVSVPLFCHLQYKTKFLIRMIFSFKKKSSFWKCSGNFIIKAATPFCFKINCSMLSILTQFLIKYLVIRWAYSPGGTVIRRICNVTFNIAIPSQRQCTSSLTIASENFHRKNHRKLSQQSWNYFNFLAISLPSLSNCHLKS